MLVILAALTLSPLQHQAPSAPCGLDLGPREERAALAQEYAGDYRLPTSILERRGMGLGSQYVVPITMHVVRTSAGTGGLSPARQAQAIQDANTAFAPSGIEFCAAGPVDYIDDDFFYDSIATLGEIDALRQMNVVPGTINIYFVESFPYCGISSFTFSSVQGIVMNNACTATPTNASTFPHEIGHYLDLFHTHETAFGLECVDGSNCQLAGDLLCDTAADPNVLGNVGSSNCAYLGAALDPCSGAAYAPPVTNFMSYSTKSCRTLFTPGQMDRALATLLNLRPELALPICAGGVEVACDPAVVNSTGSAAALSVGGSGLVLSNDLTLSATSLPTQTFGYFLNSQTLGTPSNPGNSQGIICLAGSVGRYVGPGQIMNSGAVGSMSLLLDLTQTPTPLGFVNVTGGQTWSFQLWYRDALPGSGATSNFSNAISVTFL